MNYQELEKQINSNKVSSLYLFYGEEEYLIDTTIKKIKKNFGELVLGINYVVLDENGIDELIPNIESPAFRYDRKLIMVNDSKLFKKDGRKKNLSPLQERVLDYFKENELDDSVVLIFKEKEVDKNELFKELEKRGIVCDFQELKPFELVTRLKKICSAYGVNISDSSLNHLIEVSGTNLQNLINEVRKLIEYKGKGGTINNDDIDKLAIPQIESIIFELTDNLAVKKIDKALEVLDNLLYQKEPLQKILVTLYNHFKKLYLYNISIQNKKDPITSLGLKPNQAFLVNKYRNQSKYYKIETLREIIEKLADLDYLYKNGKIDLEVGLRSLLCNYCS